MRDIPGYEGLYAITTDGYVWSYRSKKFLKPQNNGHGYLYITLCNNKGKKHFYIHRLVGEAYIPNPNDLPQINHKDLDTSNNAFSNLEWCDAKYNANYSHCKRVQCVETGVIYNSIKEAAEKNNLFDTSISAVCKGKQKTCGGYHWRYYEEN